MNAEVMQYEVLAKELMQRALAEVEPADMHEWLTRRLSALGGGDPEAALLWEESFDYYDALLAKREALALLPESERRLIDWPWASWNRIIDPMAPGMLASITAPDAQSKPSVGECLGEHGASRAHEGV